MRSIASLPGPAGLPVLGNMFQIQLPQLHRQLEQWADQFGPFFKVKLGRHPTLVVGDHAVVAQVLRDRPEGFKRTNRMEEIGREMGLKPLGRIASYATTGLDPAYMGMGPVPASQKALQRAGWKPADLDLLEINEAFAAQACAVNKEMGWDINKVNVNGGAIAIGHPIGASGCRILVTLLHEMQRQNAKKGIASLCIGGGMGVALTIER